MKFYATRPSRQRFAEDVRAFVSLLKAQRDEQARKMILADDPEPAPALHGALHAAGVTAHLEDPSFEGTAWRNSVEDPQDPYTPEAAKAVDFEPGKGKEPFGDALYRVHFRGTPTEVVGRFRAEPKGAGFTLRFIGFERKPVPPPAAKATRPDDEGPRRSSILDDLGKPAKAPAKKKSIF